MTLKLLEKRTAGCQRNKKTQGSHFYFESIQNEEFTAYFIYSYVFSYRNSNSNDSHRSWVSLWLGQTVITVLCL